VLHFAGDAEDPDAGCKTLVFCASQCMKTPGLVARIGLQGAQYSPNLRSFPRAGLLGTVSRQPESQIIKEPTLQCSVDASIARL
jgi:hypothetical protein